MIKVFISHSSKDEQLVEKVKDLLQGSLHIHSKDIRCTTIASYGLEAGALVNNQLSKEACEAEAFIALLTPTSLKSEYVLFELGARWGTGKSIISLMTPCIHTLPQPLASFNALRISSRSFLDKLVEDLAKALNLEPERPSVYEKYVVALLDEASKFEDSSIEKQKREDLNNFLRRNCIKCLLSFRESASPLWKELKNLESGKSHVVVRIDPFNYSLIDKDLKLLKSAGFFDYWTIGKTDDKGELFQHLVLENISPFISDLFSDAERF